MTNEQAQKVATRLLRKLRAEAALVDIETRSTGIMAAREARRELTDATADLQAAVAEVQ